MFLFLFLPNQFTTRHVYYVPRWIRGGEAWRCAITSFEGVLAPFSFGVEPSARSRSVATTPDVLFRYSLVQQGGRRDRRGRRPDGPGPVGSQLLPRQQHRSPSFGGGIAE